MAEIEKTERQVQQQQEREDEMREMALRLRRRYTLVTLTLPIGSFRLVLYWLFKITGSVNYAINTGHQPAATAMKIPIPRIWNAMRIKNLRVMAQPADQLNDRGHGLCQNHVDGAHLTNGITRLSGSAAQVVGVTVVGVLVVAAQAVGVEVVGAQAVAEHRGRGTDGLGLGHAEIGPRSVAIPTGNVVVIAVHRAIAGEAAILIIDSPEMTD